MYVCFRATCIVHARATILDNSSASRAVRACVNVTQARPGGPELEQFISKMRTIVFFMVAYRARLPRSATTLGYNARQPRSATTLGYHARLPRSATTLGTTSMQHPHYKAPSPKPRASLPKCRESKIHIKTSPSDQCGIKPQAPSLITQKDATNAETSPSESREQRGFGIFHPSLH